MAKTKLAARTKNKSILLTRSLKRIKAQLMGREYIESILVKINTILIKYDVSPKNRVKIMAEIGKALQDYNN